MRKVKWAVDYLNEAKKLVDDPASQKGKWRKEPYTKIHLEIGCGKGNYSLSMAKMYPQEFFIAVEKNESAAGIAAKKYDESGPDNLVLIHGDAALIDAWFDAGEIDVLHLNFSDPWPKKRYAKRRLTAPTFLKQYDTILSEDGQIRMKTDNEKLFEFSLMEFLRAGFILQDVSVNYHREPHPEDAVSEYEEKFILNNMPIYRCVFQKKEPK